jgi:hypothetical protein
MILRKDSADGVLRPSEKELNMKKLILGAQVVVRERHNGTVVVRPAYSEPAYRYRDDRGYRNHHRHRVVFVDRWGHRHVEWR